jgi:hypothetical protein
MAEDSTVVERVQELTWSLVDGEITDDELALLDSLLLSDEPARKCYAECVQLHVDLMAHYAAQPTSAIDPSQSKPTVLGSLSAGMPLPDIDLPQVEDANF